ncbi:MAG TPA: glycosyltransferase, partial [Gammaproteobacteria bacterium]|nr:glycosyltransferase [Gammaproteobacteria bacterium]
LVSVIIPTKDRPELLQYAIESVQQQDYDNWEIVVVNDGGEDVGALVRDLDDSGRCRYLRHPHSRGLPSARNTGIRFSRGDVLCYLDDDDTFRPGHLRTVVAALNQSDAEFVYTEAEYIQEIVENGRRVERGRGTPYAGIEYSLERLLVSNFIPVNTWAHRRGLLDRTGLFDPELSALEDWDMLIRCAQATDIVPVRELTVQVHLREDAGQGHMMARERKNFPELYRRIYDRYPVNGRPDIEGFRARQLAALDLEAPDTHPERTAYESWMEHHCLREIDGELIAERMMAKWKVNPSLHFIVALMDGQMPGLAATLDSLAGQLYQGWGLTVVSAAACPDPLFEETPNLEWVQVGDEAAAAVDAVVADSQADWIGVLEAGDRLEPNFTHALADYINLRPEWAFIYVDEDLIDAEGNRHSPNFKPDFNLDLLRSQPCLGGFCLVRRELLQQAGPLRFVDQPLYTHDLALKVANLCDEQVFGHIASLLFHRLDSNAGRFSGEQLDTALQLCVSDHMNRAGIAAQVGEGLLPGTTRVVYLHDSRPPVSIIIPSRDRLDLITPCVESLLDHTDWPDFEILIVDNGSESDDTYEYYDRLVAKHGERVRVLSLPGPFNFSALNNLGAREARGEYLLLLNNDTQVLHDDWLERMMAHAQRPDVGITGPRLVFGDRTLQHAGVVLGLSEVAGHIGYREPMDSAAFNGRLQSDQNYSAVTGACLLIRKSVYEEVGGLDEEALGVMYNDIDLCLRVRDRGYRIVWTPYTTLIHHGSRTLGDPAASADDRQRLDAETAAFMGRWSARISADPAYNRNLSLTHYDGRPEGDIDANWDTSFHDRPR